MKLLPVLLLLLGQNVYADPNRSDTGWLEIMAFAAHQTDYSGTFVYQDGIGGNVEVSRISHIVDADGEHERLESLSGVSRTVVSNNNQVWLFEGERKVRIERTHGEKGFPDLLPEQLSALKENYFIRQAEEDRVAGFHVHAIVFKPKDNLRYSHKMWAHSQSGLLLKAEVLDERSRIIEQYAFTQLSLGKNVDRSWVERAASIVSPREAESQKAKPYLKSKATDWQVDALPNGFKKIMQFCHPIRDKTIPVTHMVFSDGLAGISVFIEAVAGREYLNPGLSSQGAIQVYSRISDDSLITVVGEVPPRTVMQVAESVRYAGE
ncbi:MAG: MucB/RseB C-terminal domain-containing protein [Gallionellaceae bacterium]